MDSRGAAVSGWRRADEGDVPEVGQEITMVVFRSGEEGFQRWRRMRVDVLFNREGAVPRIYGAGLPCDTMLTEPWPERPDDINGRAIFWKEFEP